MITITQAREQMASLEASWGSARPSRDFLMPDIRRVQRVVDATLAGHLVPRAISPRAARSPEQLLAEVRAIMKLPEFHRLPASKQLEIIGKLTRIVRDIQALVMTPTTRSRA